MAALLKTIRASLAEVNLGLKGDLTMSENMERIVKALATDTVPTSWAQMAYPSLRTLSTWLPDLGRRASQLSEWVASFTLPNSVWISGALLFHLCNAIFSAFAQMAFWVYGHRRCILGDVIGCAIEICICSVLTQTNYGQLQVANLVLCMSKSRSFHYSMTINFSQSFAGLFNPQSFLTAVMQTTARRNGWPLDKIVIATDVTRLLPEQVDGPPKDGVYIHGLFLEGARWDDKLGALDDSPPKQLSCKMPVRSCISTIWHAQY